MVAVLPPNATGQPRQCTKPEMVSAMVKRALNAGIMADYLLADAWFGTKGMIRLTQETALGSGASNEEKQHEIPD